MFVTNTNTNTPPTLFSAPSAVFADFGPCTFLPFFLCLYPLYHLYPLYTAPPFIPILFLCEAFILN